MEVSIHESEIDDDYQIILNNSQDSINSCFNITGNRACIYSILLVEMTRKTTLWMNFILILVGLIVNVIVIAIFSRPELRKLSISIHTIGLAMSDICLLCFPVFLKLLNEYIPDFYLFRTNFWCKTHGYFDIVFCCWSAWNVVALSNERWMTICKPSKIYMQNQKRRAILTVFGIPILSLLLFIWYPFVIETNETNKKILNINTLLGHTICQPTNNFLLLLFGTCGIILTYVIPFIFITFYNSRIVKTLNERIAKRKEYFGKRVLSDKKYSMTSRHKTKCNSENLQQSISSDKIISSDNLNLNNVSNSKNIWLRITKNQFKRFSNDYSRQSFPVINTVDSDKRASESNAELLKVNGILNQYENLQDGIRSNCSSNTDILRARECINRDQRVKNDRSINTMLITVSITFLVLTFPYQFVWVCDQIYRVLINNKLNSISRDEVPNFRMIFFKHLWVYQLVSYSIKDIALTIRNLNFSINFFLYSTMSNLFRKELNILFQNIGFNNFILFKNAISNAIPIYNINTQRVYFNRSQCQSTNNLTTYDNKI